MLCVCEGWGPEGWGAQRSVGPEWWEAEPRKTEISRFFPSPAPCSLFSSRGIVVADRGHGPPKVCAWASLGSFCVSSAAWGSNGRAGGHTHTDKTHNRRTHTTQQTHPQHTHTTHLHYTHRQKMFSTGAGSGSERCFGPDWSASLLLRLRPAHKGGRRAALPQLNGLSVENGAASAFPVDLGALRIPASSRLSDAPDARESST